MKEGSHHGHLENTTVVLTEAEESKCCKKRR